MSGNPLSLRRPLTTQLLEPRLSEIRPGLGVLPAVGRALRCGNRRFQARKRFFVTPVFGDEVLGPKPDRAAEGVV